MHARIVLPLVGVLSSCAPSAPTDEVLGAAKTKLTIDSLDGEVTKHEVDVFLAYVSALAIPTSQYPNGGHNYLADGDGGTTLEGINRLYEVTGELQGVSSEHQQLLDVAIRWSDAWLSHRNDLPLGEHRVMWTGSVEPVWPPDAPPSTYAACEVGETIGILAYTALNIVSTRAIWNQTVPDGDPNAYGKTYLARAKTYVTMLEFSMDQYFNKYFVDEATLTIKRPGGAYTKLTSNNVNAWNREMMFLHAWQTLAQVHVLLGDDAARAKKYQTITRNTVDLFVANAQPTTAPDGTPVYDWGYGNFGDEKGHLTGEHIGIHGQYDIWGLTRAYRAGAAYTSATAARMKRYGDTIVHELELSPGVYASYIDRCCGTGTFAYLPSGFIFLTPYAPAIYRDAATADMKSGRQAGSVALTSGILWAKHWLASQAQTCVPTTCAAAGAHCGDISDGCGGTLSCGECATGQSCSSAHVCTTTSGACAPSIASVGLGVCGATVEYNGSLYECVSQAAGVNGEPSGCGTSGVYCSAIPPDSVPWGATAWKLLRSCN